MIYIVMAIDENQNDKVLAVFSSFSKAKDFCTGFKTLEKLYDIWIDKHRLDF